MFIKRLISLGSPWLRPTLQFNLGIRDVPHFLVLPQPWPYELPRIACCSSLIEKAFIILLFILISSRDSSLIKCLRYRLVLYLLLFFACIIWNIESLLVGVAREGWFVVSWLLLWSFGWLLPLASIWLCLRLQRFHLRLILVILEESVLCSFLAYFRCVSHQIVLLILGH